MDRETLYKFFEGAASYEEEVRIRQWMEHSPENRREFLKERTDIRFDVASLVMKKRFD